MKHQTVAGCAQSVHSNWGYSRFHGPASGPRARQGWPVRSVVVKKTYCSRIVFVLYPISKYANTPYEARKKFPQGECVDGVNSLHWLSGLGMTAVYSTAMVLWDDDIEW